MYYHRGGNSANKSRETEKLPNICIVGDCSSAYFAKKEFTGKTTVSYRRNWFRCNSKIYKHCRRQTFVCESQENGIYV